jgi:hypothetical protein
VSAGGWKDEHEVIVCQQEGGSVCRRDSTGKTSLVMNKVLDEDGVLLHDVTLSQLAGKNDGNVSRKGAGLMLGVGQEKR